MAHRFWIPSYIGTTRAISSRIAAVPSKWSLSANSGRARFATSRNTSHSGRASPTRGPGISGLKMIRRSVDVSVTPEERSADLFGAVTVTGSQQIGIFLGQGFILPFPVTDSPTAVRFAAELEERVAAVYSDLVRATTGDQRRTAAGALREAAVRAVRWNGESVAFPGLAERAGTPTPTASSPA